MPSPHSDSRRQPSLSQLLRRILWSFSLALAGTWGLLVPRLYLVNPESGGLTGLWFYTDLASLTLAIFGIFMVVYHHSRLAPRLSRLGRLGETGWGPP
ncbi:MAG: hypothetical protein LBQ79_09540 [Deltaproteobacteria bacterium]|jgi:Na+-driven multidrug efflux pump|nr:hypothetical protein [Deltaproteobacteria bacterium]